MNDLGKNVKSEAQWLRGLFMLLYFIIYEITEMVVISVAIVQFLFTIITGENNANLKRFGDCLGQYAKQTIDYITYNDEEKPFPFAEWPSAKIATSSPQDQEESEETPPTTGS